MNYNNFIWDLDSCRKGNIPEKVAPLFNVIAPYILNFLTSKHPFRKGVMCPFMPKAIETGNVFFSYFDGEESIIQKSIDFFEEDDSGARTVIILFEENYPIDSLLRLHIKYKVKCVKKNIMLGALFENSDASSLHNKNYFPLRTPNPVLVLRNVTPSDLIFLNPSHHSNLDKIVFLNSYIKAYKNRKSPYIIKQLKEARHYRNYYLIKYSSKFLILLLILILILWLIL
ncbi:DUF6875 domain-containing protein [Acinetobacter radioresistens]|uniref:DUF6875 domain-containing protein n=1 Tax=Acinetobacter radioresistens TaxID=40216 RepID=UPI000E744615|nr:hypothetical protein [Acinetobacter radioresistens]RJL70002.1 hypothetical protein D5055_11975 [Acinetobacter radioresistens]